MSKKEYVFMDTETKEAAFRAIFTRLDENGQDRLLDTARALSFAANTRNREEPSGESRKPRTGTDEAEPARR
jgi:hypothetical protein